MKFEISNSVTDVINQVLAIFCASFGLFSAGSVLGWLSPALLILDSDDSPLETGRLTVEQISLLGGMQSTGALVSVIVIAIYSYYFGLRKTVWISAVPAVICWMLVIFTKKVEYLFVARFLGGALIGCVFYAIPLFIAEISDEHIRGRMSSMLIILQNLGLLFAYLLGASLPYVLSASFLLIGPIAVAVTFVFIPDTPSFLLNKNDEKEFERSLNFYKNCKDDTERNNSRKNAELSKLKNLLENDSFKEKLSYKDFSRHSVFGAMRISFLATPEARYGFFIGIVTAILDVFHGNVILISYSSIIFQESGSDLDPIMSLVVFASIQLIGSSISTFLIDRIGRKILLSISTFLCTVAYTSLGIYSFLSERGADVNVVNWVPLTCASIAIFGSSVGISPISMIVPAESFPAKIRSQGVFVCNLIVHLLMIVANVSFPLLTHNYNLYVPMWIFAAVCGAAFFYAVFLLKETNRKNLFLPD